jgi:hypothetical protein
MPGGGKVALHISLQDSATVFQCGRADPFAAATARPDAHQPQGNFVIYSPLKLQIFRSYSHLINRPQ